VTNAIVKITNHYLLWWD